jgi:serine/threonine protein kinase
MSTTIGHFEILSELAKSATGAVYKANDPQTSQTVALKAIQLSAFGERAAELQQCLLAEAETTKVLSHSNLTPVFGAQRRIFHLGSPRYRKAGVQRPRSRPLAEGISL